MNRSAIRDPHEMHCDQRILTRRGKMKHREAALGAGAGSRTTIAVFAALLLATNASCRRQQSSGEEASARPPAQSNERSADWNYPDENFDDPETLREPRIQFVWSAPGESRESIWSINLAGSDIRRVAGPELVYGAGIRDFNQIPVRSPNRRYIACVGNNESGDQVRYLIDLKTRTVRIMKQAAGIAHFNWTRDSRYVLFYGDIKLWKYDVETGSVTEEPMIYSRGLYLVRDGFIAVRDGEIAFYSTDRKLKWSVPHPYKNIFRHKLSKDEALLMLDMAPDSVVVRREDPTNPLYHGQVGLEHADFGPDGRAIFFFERDRLHILELETEEVRELYRLPAGGVPGNATLVEALRP